VATAELTRDGVQVNIEPQSLRLLEYLIQRRERVVSRADFVDAIRQGRAI
jgi:DNA-binding winged helix-turn-helix (wHTH) protein